ncbi:tRNA adenosine(34) deaminase TadA [Bdellovibrio sp. HCB337]|uniref:tRNA adenosine(34) deaminase TadA n=1 Tax=Bdellovibrio sp. HCB337 TaxID=3394358 RepID=UPI0039A69E7D
MKQKAIDEKWMKRALSLAEKAAAQGEVPVGAILVGPDGLPLAQSYNHRETWQSPLAHAESIVLHTASKKTQNWRLEDCTLYVTLEPCLMCAGALLQSRVRRVVYGAKDPRGGAVESLYQTFQDSRLNHQIEITSGVLETECSDILSQFFQERREDHRREKESKNYRYRSSVIVVHKNKVLGFHAIDPHSKAKYIFMPGGQIDSGESAEQAAIRETLEETGYKIRLLPELKLQRRYDFEWNGKVHHCDTTFFVGTLDEDWHEPRWVEDADYNKGPTWIPAKDINKVFAYHPDLLWGVQWGLKRALASQKKG